MYKVRHYYKYRTMFIMFVYVNSRLSVHSVHRNVGYFMIVHESFNSDVEIVSTVISAIS